jgi:protocatechuate 3,4-dioxygenase beta subunit
MTSAPDPSLDPSLDLSLDPFRDPGRGPVSRRTLLRHAGLVSAAGALAGAGGALIPGVGSAAGAATRTTTRRTATTRALTPAANCSVIPAETGGPFPGDGSNGPNVLTQPGVVRRDIRSSFGTSSTRAVGVPLTIELTVTSLATGCRPAAGAAVYVWHCDAQGRYSMYSDGVTGENYLRGVQAADAAGSLSFVTVVPGCYPGRWPHVHFEVYPTLASATDTARSVATSQLALPRATCEAVYATRLYPGSASSLSRLSLASDMVFGDDGGTRQLATVTGTAASGYTARLAVTIP